jgi:hypothetical protein
VIYLDSSVLLAKLFAETRIPPDSLWRAELISSRLLEYEIWSRIHARQLTNTPTLDEQTRQLLDLVQLLELSPKVLTRALEPFPIPLRTLDALHLASLDYVRRRHQSVVLASFDTRLQAGARALNIALYDL